MGEGAHPRSRGENVGTVDAHRSRQGSSPLTRGKQTPRTGLSEGRGLIPAHAGKTAGQLVLGGEARAHPRSRGENPRPAGIGTLAQGLIPAHAGKTRS